MARPAANDGRATTPPSLRSRWPWVRVGYLAVAVSAPWFTLAFLYPSPIGLWVPAVPYLLVALAGSAAVLALGLVRPGGGAHWAPAYRSTVAIGVIVGVAAAALLGVTGQVALGCPTLPPSSSLTPVGGGWQRVPTAAWTAQGRPVLYFFGATWCPYCSASSWAIWKALTEFGTLQGTSTSYSYGPPEPYPYTPEIVLAGASLASSTVAFQVSEYNGSTDGATVAPSSCVQSAYVSAYSAGDIPFLVVNGQYVHVGSLYDPGNLSAWNRSSQANGAEQVRASVENETGAPWLTVRGQAWWIMAFLAHASGSSVATLASQYGWSLSTEQNVSSLVGRLS